MLITLNKIKKHNPCTKGWKTILKARGDDKAKMDLEFPLSEALESNSLGDVIWALICFPEGKQIAKRYALWCAESVRHLMKDKRSKNALDATKKYLDGEIDIEELRVARRAAVAYSAAYPVAVADAYSVAAVDVYSDAAAAVYSADYSFTAAYSVAADVDAFRKKQKEKLIEVLTVGKWVD